MVCICVCMCMGCGGLQGRFAVCKVGSKHQHLNPFFVFFKTFFSMSNQWVCFIAGRRLAIWAYQFSVLVIQRHVQQINTQIFMFRLCCRGSTSLAGRRPANLSTWTLVLPVWQKHAQYIIARISSFPLYRTVSTVHCRTFDRPPRTHRRCSLTHTLFDLSL